MKKIFFLFLILMSISINKTSFAKYPSNWKELTLGIKCDFNDFSQAKIKKNEFLIPTNVQFLFGVRRKDDVKRSHSFDIIDVNGQSLWSNAQLGKKVRWSHKGDYKIKGKKETLFFVFYYFKSSKKINVEIKSKTKNHSGDIWGKCIDTTDEIITAKLEISDQTSKWLEHPRRAKIKSNITKNNFSLFMAKKPCPTNFQWFWADNFSKHENKYYVKWKKIIEKKLAQYPIDTIIKCTKKNYLILKNKITDHVNNTENFTRSVGTMVWEKDLKKIFLKIIVESNYLNKKPDGVIYNENLQKICDTYTSNQGNIRKVKVKCVGLPEEINAIVNVTDFKTVKFKAIGKGGGYKIFLTNEGLDNARLKYPEVFKN